MGAAEEQLTSLGIAVKDVTGDVRPVSDILDQLASQWNSLSSEQQQNTAVTLAGREHLSRFLALMEGFSTAQEASSVSMGSFGSAAREQEKYADSLQARLNILQNRWTELSLVLGEAFLSDGIIAFTEIAGGALEKLAGFAENVGMLPPLFAAASVAVFLLSKNFRILSTAMIFGADSLSDANRQFANIEAGASRATVATNVFKTAMRGLLATTGVGLVFAGIGLAVEKLTSAYADARAKQEEFTKNQETSLESLSSDKDKVDELVESYTKLSSIDRNNEQEEEYLRIQNELAALLPSVKAGEDEKGNAILYNSGILEERIKLLEREAELEKQKTLLQAPNTLSQNADSIKKAREELEKLQKEQEKELNYANSMNTINKSGDVTLGVQAESAQKKADELSADISEKFDEINKKTVESTEAIAAVIGDMKGLTAVDIQWISDQSIEKGYTTTEQIKELAKRVSALKKDLGDGFNLDGFSVDQLDAVEKIADSGQKVKEGTNAYNEQVASLTSLKVGLSDAETVVGILSGSLEKQTIESQAAAQTYSEEGDAMAEAFEGSADAVDSMDEAIQNARGNYQALLDIAQELVDTQQHQKATELLLGDAYNALTDEVSPLNNLLKKLAEGKQLSAAEAVTLMQNEEDLAGAISIQNGVISVNQDAIIKLRDAKVKSYTDMQNAVQQDLINQANATVKILNNYGLQIEAIKSVADARKALTEAGDEIGDTIASGGTMNGQDMAKIQALSEQRNELDGIVENLDGIEKMKSMVEASSTALNEVGTSNEKLSESNDNVSESEKDKQEEIESSKYVAEKYKLDLEKLNLEIEKQNNLLNDYPGHSKKYRDAVKSEIKMLKEKKQILQEQSKSLERQIKSGYIAPTGIVTTTSGGSTSSGLGYSPLSSNVGGGKYGDYINQAAQKYGVDANLIAAIIKQESNFNTNARSGAGAMGLMQLMPGTASDLGVKNAYDPYQNIMGGTKYIAQQLEKFGGDIQKALYAYNAGAGNVSKILSSAQGQWKEPKNYADRVLANYSKYAGSVVTQTTDAAKSVADYYKNNFRQTSDYMEKRGSTKHKGIDLANGKQGDPVKSLQNGKVITAAYSKSAGYWVVVQQDDGTVAKYMHMQKGLDVKAGDRVAAGQQLGKVGNTGQSTGAHLHLQIEDQSGNTINPNTYLDALTDYSSTVAQNQQNVANARSEVVNLQSEIAGIDEQIEQLNYDIVESYLAGYDKRIADLDVNLAKYDTELQKYDETSEKWRSITSKQLNDTKRQKSIQEEKIRFIQREIKTNKALTAAQRVQLSQELNNAQITLEDYKQQLFQIEESIMSSKVEEKLKKIADAYEKITDKFENLSDKISMTPEEKDQVKYYSDQYKNLQQQQKAVKDYIKQLKEQRKTVKGFPDLYDQITSEIENWEDKQKDLTLEVYNTGQAISSIYQNMSDEVVDIYKEMYEKMRDIELKNAEDATNKIIDEIDSKADDEQFNKELEKRNKELQELQDKYGKLSLDDSEWAKSQREDLKKQIEEAQESLDEFLQDREDEKRKEALTDQLEKDTEAINDKYDDLINDDRYFDSIEQKIMNGQIKDINKQLSSFTDFINKNMEEIGNSISNNLVDRLKEASDALTVIVSGNKTGKNVSSFDTGGYTGSWGSSTGKLAMLHQKEIVLNQHDTANVLDIVKEARSISDQQVQNAKMPLRKDAIQNASTLTTMPIQISIDKLMGDASGANELFNTFNNKLTGRGLILRTT